VLANWDNVLRAISLASSKLERIHFLIAPVQFFFRLTLRVSFSPTAKASGLHDASPDEGEDPARETRLPATLVRIPAEPREKTGE
jgi:DASH complex subunit DAD2